MTDELDQLEADIAALGERIAKLGSEETPPPTGAEVLAQKLAAAQSRWVTLSATGDRPDAA
jgi:hypothetical protein